MSLRSHVTILTALILTVCWPLTAAASPGETDPLGRSAGELELTLADETWISGSFGRADSLVSFESRRDVPERIAVVVEFNGSRVEATYDLVDEVVRLDGGGAVVFQPDREVLSALARRFEIDDKALPANAHGEFLYRIVNFLSQAPAGVVLDARELRRPGTVGVEAPLEAAGWPQRDVHAWESPVEKLAEKCQANGDAGITYLGGGCSWLYYNSYHDANSHCYANTPTYAGCNHAGDCLGRCGGGCGGDGKGTYSTDCKDHDKCCRFHGGCTNPWASDCGDEYWEADDDYVWGATNCNGCS